MLEMPFGCSICKKSFAKAASLSKHVELYHSRKEPKIASKEPKTTANTETNQEKLKKETQTNEIKEFAKIQTVYEATKNNFLLNSLKEKNISKEIEENRGAKKVQEKNGHNFEQHTWRRTKQPCKVTPFKCSICNLSFPSKFDLKRHIANVHERRNPIKHNIEFQGPNHFKCKICDAKFFAIGGMNQHMANIHRVESIFNFKCNICGKVYKNNADLKKHNEAVHEQKKPYYCSIGNVTFADNTKLKNHFESQEYLKKIAEINGEWMKSIQQTNNGKNTNQDVKENPTQIISPLEENYQQKDGNQTKNNVQQLSTNPDLLYFAFKNGNSCDSFPEDCAMDLTVSENSSKLLQKKTFLEQMIEKYPASTTQELLNLDNIVKRVKEKFLSSKTYQNSNSKINAADFRPVDEEKTNETVCEVRKINVNQSIIQVDFRNSIYEIPTLINTIQQKESLPFEMDIDVENIIKRVKETFSNSKTYQNSNLEVNAANFRAMVQKEEINENVCEVKKINNNQSIVQMDFINTIQQKESYLFEIDTHADNLIKRVKEKFSSSKTYQCNTCAKQFSRKSSLRRHELIHTNEPQHELPQHELPQHELPQHEIPQHEMPQLEPQHEMHELTPHEFLQHEIPQHEMPQLEPQHELPEHVLPQHELPQHELPQHDLTQHELTQYEFLQHEIPQHELTQHELPQHVLPPHELPQQELPQQELPQHEFLQHEIPQHEFLQHGIPQHEVPQHEWIEHVLPPHELTQHELPQHKLPENELPLNELPQHEHTEHVLPPHELTPHELPQHELPQHLLPQNELPQNELPQHELSQYEPQHGKQPFACKVCDKNFTSNASLKRHKTIHTGDKPYACQFCNKTFRLKQHVKVHERYHTGEKPFNCKICNKGFADYSNKKDHELKHTYERPLSCNICDKTFKESKTLRRHVRTHEGKNYSKERLISCNLVDLVSLANEKMVKKENTPSMCTCRYCGEQFNQYLNMKRHELNHLQEMSERLA